MIKSVRNINKINLKPYLQTLQSIPENKFYTKLLRNRSELFNNQNNFKIPRSAEISKIQKLYLFKISKNYSFNKMECKDLLIKSKEDTLKFIKDNGFAVHHVEEHEKIDTVQAGLDKFKTVSFNGSFTFAKNLFMKNKAGGLYLITVHPVKFFLKFRIPQSISKI